MHVTIDPAYLAAEDVKAGEEPLPEILEQGAVDGAHGLLVARINTHVQLRDGRQSLHGVRKLTCSGGRGRGGGYRG